MSQVPPEQAGKLHTEGITGYSEDDTEVPRTNSFPGLALQSRHLSVSASQIQYSGPDL